MYSPALSEELFCKDFEGLELEHLKLISVRFLRRSFRMGAKIKIQKWPNFYWYLKKVIPNKEMKDNETI